MRRKLVLEIDNKLYSQLEEIVEQGILKEAGVKTLTDACELAIRLLIRTLTTLTLRNGSGV